MTWVPICVAVFLGLYLLEKVAHQFAGVPKVKADLASQYQQRKDELESQFQAKNQQLRQRERTLADLAQQQDEKAKQHDQQEADLKKREAELQQLQTEYQHDLAGLQSTIRLLREKEEELEKRETELNSRVQKAKDRLPVLARMAIDAAELIVHRHNQALFDAAAYWKEQLKVKYRIDEYLNFDPKTLGRYTGGGSWVTDLDAKRKKDQLEKLYREYLLELENSTFWEPETQKRTLREMPGNPYQVADRYGEILNDQYEARLYELALRHLEESDVAILDTTPEFEDAAAKVIETFTKKAIEYGYGIE